MSIEGMTAHEHEYGTTGATIYCVKCDAEWDIPELMALNPTPRQPADVADYPEHAKLRRVSIQSQACGEFFSWLTGEKHYELAKIHTHTDECWPEGENHTERRRTCGVSEDELIPTPVNIRKLLAEFFDIDETKIENEKQAMLNEIRSSKTV